MRRPILFFLCALAGVITTPATPTMAQNSINPSDIVLSADDGIEWDRISSNITAFGNSVLSRDYLRADGVNQNVAPPTNQGLNLKSTREIKIFSKKDKATNKVQIERVVAKKTAELNTPKMTSQAGQIDMFFIADPFKPGAQVIDKINFLDQVQLVSIKNNNSAMTLYANKATAYRDKKTLSSLSRAVPRDTNKNPFAELQSYGGVKIVEQQFEAKGNKLLWFFDNGLGWLYAPVVVVTTGGGKPGSDNKPATKNAKNIIYAQQSLQYNQTDDWARAQHGVKVITKKNETIVGERGYYFPRKQEFIICGNVSITRFGNKGNKETLLGQCANSDFLTGLSTIEGKNVEQDMLKIVGADSLLSDVNDKASQTTPKDGMQQDEKPLKKLNNKPLDKRGRVRAIIDLN